MLDDLTIAGRVDGLDDVPEGMGPLDPVRGRPDVFGASCCQGILFVTFCPATKIVTVRISVPRLASSWPQRVNFPLVPLRSVEDLGPDCIALEVSKALHLGPLLQDEIQERLPLREWAVIRSSHAVDLNVPDPLKCLMGCLGLQRRHEGQRTLFGSPISTVQWASRPLRVKLYAKGLELRSRVRRARSDEAARELEHRAEEAERVLRLEVSFLQVRSLRGLLGWDAPFLPTLSLMCDPLIDRWVITREADRLRLCDEQADEDPRVFFPGRVRNVGTRLLQVQRDLADGGCTMGRRKTLTPARLWDLAAAFFLLSGYKVHELASMSGRSPSALAEMQAELRELGIAPDASFSGTAAASVSEIMKGLRPYILWDGFPNFSHWKGRVGRVEAPWAEGEENEVEPEPESGVVDVDDDSIVQDVGIGET